MKELFAVWYTLSITGIEDGHLVGALIVNKDLTSCEEGAARVVAAKPRGTVKWLCHEMTVKVDGTIINVDFPEL